MRFFDAGEQRTLRVFCDLVTAQDAEPRIPVLEMVDAKLAAGRARRLPPRRHARGPADLAARRGRPRRGGGRLVRGSRTPTRRAAWSSRFAAGELQGGVWERLPCRKAWGVVMRGVLSAFYSHPWAWNEIGYGGPAYPRGYMRLGEGQREPHQAAEAGEEDPVRAVRAGGAR